MAELTDSPETPALPLGSEPPPPERPGTSLRAWGCVLAVVAMLFCILVPNFLKARARGQLTACKSNLKNLATALEMYREDHQGRLPGSLEELTGPKYLTVLPTCPSYGWQPSYSYRVRPGKAGMEYEMMCLGNHENAYTGFDGDKRGLPQYRSQDGLIDHP